MLFKGASITLFYVFRHVAIAYATNNVFNQTKPSTGVPMCNALIAAGLGDRVLTLTNPAYEDSINRYWSYNSRLHPWCLVQPRTAQEVSLALTTLVSYNDGAGDWHIALRSGGHSLAASNNIDEGVTIDLAQMNGSTYNKETNLASVGPGGKWMNVFRALQDEYSVSVVEGRDGDVGVGGFLTGGGISYYTPRKGFACDNVASMQVVLANGSIVTASEDENDDLYLALKGGSLNAGIVTRFHLEAFPARNNSYGQQIMTLDHSKEFAQAVVDFVDSQGPDDALIPTWTRMPSTGNATVVLAIKVNAVGESNTTAFHQIDKIASIDNTIVSIKPADAAAVSEIASEMNTFWRTLTFANNIDILNRCVELNEVFINKMLRFVPAKDFNVVMIPQPFPQQYITARVKQGQNILGLQRSKDNALLWTGGVQLNPNRTSEADFAKAQALVNEWAADIADYARSLNGLEEYVALNYADASQNPLRSYGEKNVEFPRKVAKKYDPNGVFQRRIPGGFKISRVI